jgi:C-terminal processing protease CtpA/Prc
LPNEIYLTEDGKSFDATGIPPDLAVPVFSQKDLDARRDPGIEKVVEVLNNPNP